MGKIEKGILGGFNGKVGNVIGGHWKGIAYMRSKSASSEKKKASEKQIIQRAKFLFATNFLQPLQPIVQIGFRTLDVKKSPRNAAMSDFLNYTLEGEYPAFSVNYQNLKLSKGSLEGTDDCSVEVQDGKAVISWSLDCSSQDDKEKNKLLAFLLENRAILATIAEGYKPKFTLYKYKRSDSTGEVALPKAPSGTTVHCYLAFYTDDGSMRVSNTDYVGAVTVP